MVFVFYKHDVSRQLHGKSVPYASASSITILEQHPVRITLLLLGIFNLYEHGKVENMPAHSHGIIYVSL